jgi:NDP-sugar pyrophosphorylase family protein
MKAMILAAGLGTRLKPLTDLRPKVLLEAGPYTLLEFAIRKLKSAGFDELIINVHHFAPLVVDYLRKNNNFGCHISISDESEALLDTGGALAKAAWFFNDEKPFLIYNADIVGDMDLGEFYRLHLAGDSLATLSVRSRKTTRYLLFDTDMRLCGWENTSTGEKRIAIPSVETQAFAFSGIHAISPQLLPLLDSGRFSIIDTYLKLAAEHRIVGWVDHSTLWADAGKPESLGMAGKIAEGIKF